MTTPGGDKSLPVEVVAGNGLLHRRLFLTQGAALVGAGQTPVVTELTLMQLKVAQ